MDADRNGIPCQTVYNKTDVVAHWGEPHRTRTENVFAFVLSADDDPPRTVIVDYAQWFWGDDAEEACREDGHDEDFCIHADEYYWRNVNPRLRVMPVSDDALIVVLEMHSWLWPTECDHPTAERLTGAGLVDQDPTTGCIVEFDILAVTAAENASWSSIGLMMWMIVENGEVTALAEQYVP